MSWQPETSPGQPDNDVAALAARFLEDAKQRSRFDHPTGVGVRQQRLQSRGVKVATGGRKAHPQGGARQRRLRERRRQKMARHGLFGTASLVVLGLVAAAALGLFVQGQIGDHAPATVAPPARPRQPATLLAVSEGRAISEVTVFGLSPDQSGGVVVLIPPGTRVEVPAAGLATLSEAYATGTDGLLEASVANLLGIRFDARAVIPRDRMADVFRRVSPIHIDVPRRITFTHPDGNIEVKYTAGPQDLSAEQLVEYMTYRGQDSELDRVSRQQVAWEAWLTAAGPQADGDLQRAGVGGDTTEPLRRVITRVAETSRDYQILPVQQASVGSDVEIFQPNPEEIKAMIERELPGSIPPAASEGRVKVDVRNGNGRIGVSQRVAGLLVPAGYQIVVTGNADNFQHESTDVVFYDDAREDTARDVVRILGTGRLVLNRFPSGVADITVIVGKDFPNP